MLVRASVCQGDHAQAPTDLLNELYTTLVFIKLSLRDIAG